VIKQTIDLLNQTDADLVSQIWKFDPNEVSGACSKKRREKML
jgi:hypothetical protein